MMDEKSFFKNCLRVEECDGWLKPQRFTEKQLNSYKKEPNWYKRCFCPAGVCLDVVSSASTLTMEYRILYAARNWASFDVYVDQVFVQTIELADLESGNISIQFEQSGEKRITIYLPQLVEIELKNIRFDASALPAPDYQKKLLVLGDSITQGFSARRPSSSYPVQLARFWEASLLNLAIGGDIYYPDHLDELGFQPDRIIIAYGTNDWSRETDVMISYIRGYYEKLQKLYSCREVYALLPIWRDDWKNPRGCGSFEELKRILTQEISQFPHVRIIDGKALLPNIRFYTDDGLHPTDEGFLHYALHLVKAIGKM